MQALLTLIATWLSIQFGLPATAELPQVERASAAQMAAVRHHRVAQLQPAHAPGSAAGVDPHAAGEGVFAMYDDATRTIYLDPDWTGTSPAETSLLVHEMVHHLQNVAGLKFNCAGEREKDAYRAQRAWLELFGRTLEGEFGIDPMTLLVRTNCGF
ncbi:MAG TPA: DUF6647 family protein [Burkholderiaceae bacterium]|nr:DUF6647 family protein [Burkholderiaceae bacterium]